jgi:hypothetical protein
MIMEGSMEAKDLLKTNKVNTVEHCGGDLSQLPDGYVSPSFEAAIKGFLDSIEVCGSCRESLEKSLLDVSMRIVPGRKNVLELPGKDKIEDELFKQGCFCLFTGIDCSFVNAGKQAKPFSLFNVHGGEFFLISYFTAWIIIGVLSFGLSTGIIKYLLIALVLFLLIFAFVSTYLYGGVRRQSKELNFKIVIAMVASCSLIFSSYALKNKDFLVLAFVCIASSFNLFLWIFGYWKN